MNKYIGKKNNNLQTDNPKAQPIQFRGKKKKYKA